MSIASEITSAAGIMKDWLGDGGEPVDPRISMHRAVICENCPQNAQGKWWEYAKHSIAEVMRMHLEVKNNQMIDVPNESKLNICQVCGCCLPLKVHVPLKHILVRTDSETLSKFPENCWIPSETKANA